MVDLEVLDDIRNASSALGEVHAFVHVAGYSFALGFAKIKWLLEKDRWRACGMATIEDFAASIQFDKSMRAAAEERKELVVLFKQADKEKPISNRQIAKALNVGEATVRRDDASNDAEVEQKPNDIKQEKSPTAPNDAPVRLSGERAARLVTNKVKGQAVKKERRASREAELGARQSALPNKRYGVIYADPEWEFEVYSAETGMDRSAENHYQTSDVEKIKARAVPDISAPDCILFLWATVPMLPEALAVMDAWGFTYKSNYTWVKDRIGTGYWSRNKHEHLLIGTRGNVPAPAMGDQWPSVIDAPIGQHSEKPEIFLRLVETYFPTLPKIELNRRGPARKGWDAWGNEALT